MLKKHKNILFSIIFIILAFFGYWYFFLSKKTNTQATGTTVVAGKTGTTGTQQPSQKSYDKEFVANLQTIQYISLDTTVITTPAYKALSFPERPFQVDYNIPVGRKNPFLPIGAVGPEGSLVSPQVQASAPVEDVPVTPVATTTRPNPTPRR